jgi:hypothetical protein
VTFKFWEMLKNASEVTLLPNYFFFLEIFNFVQSFVEFKVSLSDGMNLRLEFCISDEFLNYKHLYFWWFLVTNQGGARKASRWA